MREGIDGFLTELTSTDAMKALDEKRNEFSEMASNIFSKSAKTEANEPAAKEESAKDRSAKETSATERPANEQSDEQNFEPASGEKEDELEFSGTPEALDADKAQELADKLGAKPSAPADENLAAFAHHDDELKSA
ncbi:MAG: hypothetical protein HYX67_16725 [Candidatus Melainabacteria bacterium]|nr:hypothetical protein [Candidatus Melainabacteria bacterium]